MRPTYTPVPIFEYGVRGSMWAAGYHTGRDYQAGVGTPLRATRAGHVIFAGYHGGWGADYGNHVIVQTVEGGKVVRAIYAHMSKFAVKTNDWVAEGQRIGNMGATGHVTGPHCHYEERTSPYTYWDHRRPVFDLTSAVPIIDASAFAAAVKGRKAHIHGSLVKHELAAQVGRGLMSLSSDYLGRSTRRQFSKLQKKWYGKDLGGIPGERLLSKLGNWHGKWTTVK